MNISLLTTNMKKYIWRYDRLNFFLSLANTLLFMIVFINCSTQYCLVIWPNKLSDVPPNIIYLHIILGSCPPLSNISNGDVSYSNGGLDGRYLSWTNGTYSCNDGYSLGSFGWRVRTCQGTHWNGYPKSCYRKYFQYFFFIYYIIIN